MMLWNIITFGFNFSNILDIQVLKFGFLSVEAKYHIVKFNGAESRLRR